MNPAYLPKCVARSLLSKISCDYDAARPNATSTCSKRCLLRLGEWMSLAVTSPRVPTLENRLLDGLITNDKFCFTRRSRLKLRPKRRGYPSRKGVRRGGIDETELDRSTRDGRSRRRRPSLGPGLCAPPPLGSTEGKHERGGS